MATQGPNSPGSSTTADRSGGPNWSNSGNILTSNDSRATVTIPTGTESDWLIASNFGFSIPSDATITDILLEVEAQSTATNSLGAFARLFKTAIGTDPSSEYGVYTGAGIYYGSDNYFVLSVWINANLWGTTWTPAQINASTFGAAIYIGNYYYGSDADCLVDHFRITVDYTDPSGHPAMRRFGGVPGMGQGQSFGRSW